MPIPLLPVLGAIAKFVVANGGRVAVRKYGAKAVEKATKQIQKRQKAIDKKVDKKWTDKDVSKSVESRRAKALEKRLKAEKPKARFDEEGFPLEEVPLKFTKGGRVAKSSGGSVSARLSKAGPVAKPN